MKFSVWALATALSAASGAAPTAPAMPAVVTQPDWIAKPTGADLARNYPKVAQLLDIEGYAVIKCDVDAYGALQACKAADEQPLGQGFGPAALAMASAFRMRPMTRNGQPVDGGKITIPIRFRLPVNAPEPAPAAVPQADPTTVALARRYAGQIQSEELELMAIRSWADRLESTDETTPKETRSAAADALRKAAEADAALYAEDKAAALASTYSPAELAGIVAFVDTPAGAVLKPNMEMVATSGLVALDTWRRIRAEARAAFCSSRDCNPAISLMAATKAAIPNPSWSQAPSEVMIENARPWILAALGLAGSAQLLCHVDAQATPSDCTVAAEAPAGMGVGTAATSLATKFRVHPILMSQGAQGQTIALGLSFPKPPDLDPYSPRPARSARALELAKELTAMTNRQDEIMPVAERAIDTLAARPPPGADPAVTADAQSALRVAVIRARVAYHEEMASAQGALFSEDQLAGAIAFLHTPAGQALIAKQEQSHSALAVVSARAHRRILADARVLFCKDHPCDAGPIPPLTPAR
jgi:TonB family protein